MNDERNLGEKTDDSGQQPRYEHYQFHEEQRTVLKPSGPSEHRRNQNSFQKKAGTTIALAVIFGLVAAVVFQAANFAADRFLNTGKSSVQINYIPQNAKLNNGEWKSMGNNVVEFQLKQAKKEKEELLSSINIVNDEISKTEQLKKLIENINWDSSYYDFNSPSNLKILEKQKNELAVQIQELKNSPDMLAAMKEIEFAQKSYKMAEQEKEKSVEACTTNANKIESVQKEIAWLETDLNSKQESYSELIKRNPELENEMHAEYERQSAIRKSPIVIGEKHMKQLNVDVENAKKNLENEQLEYNKLSDLPLENRGIEFISFYLR